MGSGKYLSIFSPASRQQRQENFENYWQFSSAKWRGTVRTRQGFIQKTRPAQDISRSNPVKLRHPLPDPEAFYRNYVAMEDDPASLDRMTLMLTGMYKFARHEWVGIKGAWEAGPGHGSLAQAGRQDQPGAFGRRILSCAPV